MKGSLKLCQSLWQIRSRSTKNNYNNNTKIGDTVYSLYRVSFTSVIVYIQKLLIQVRKKQRNIQTTSDTAVL